jgi:hypothetical protein
MRQEKLITLWTSRLSTTFPIPNSQFLNDSALGNIIVISCRSLIPASVSSTFFPAPAHGGEGRDHKRGSVRVGCDYLSHTHNTLEADHMRCWSLYFLFRGWCSQVCGRDACLLSEVNSPTNRAAFAFQSSGRERQGIEPRRSAEAATNVVSTKLPTEGIPANTGFSALLHQSADRPGMGSKTWSNGRNGHLLEIQCSVG